MRDDAPQPRVLFKNASDEVFERLKVFAGTSGRIGVDVAAVHDSDWDVLVSFYTTEEARSAPRRISRAGPRRVHHLSFGGEYFPLSPEKVISGVTGIRLPGTKAELGPVSHARAMRAESGRYEALVQRSIVTPAPSAPRRVFEFNGTEDGVNLNPLATVGEERAVVAFTAFSKVTESYVWALPEYTTSHDEWLAEFQRFLHTIDQEKFPGEPDWQAGASWGTPAIRQAVAELERLQRERVETIARIDAAAAEASVRIAAAVSEAAVGPHRLLAADGDDLVAAVMEALRDLGFSVEDMDGHHDAVTRAKLEDLRVTDPADPNWVCLIEVKGYTRGAKANDVSQITGRPMRAFILKEAREPSAVWHVVNTWRTQSPGTRKGHGLDDLQLGVLTDATGALIDTRDLFKAWRDVQEGTAIAADVRESLRTAITRWEYSP